MLSFKQFLIEAITNSLQFPIDNLKTSRGEIGRQGLSGENLYGILKDVTGIENEEFDINKSLSTFKSDKQAQNKFFNWMKNNPINVSEMPNDEGFVLRDGHHRAFLMDQIGEKDIPTILKRAEGAAGRPVDIAGADQAKKIAVKGADVLGRLTSVMDPLSAAGEFVAGKIAPVAGAVASMYGLADSLFAKDAKADSPMMEPERKEQEEKDDLVSAAMNPGNKPVVKGAAVELKRAEFRRNQEKAMAAK